MSSKPTAVRHDWIRSSHFHDLQETDVLNEIGRRIKKTQETAHPLVLLDLDSTLYEVEPRTHQILLEWIDSPQSTSFPIARDKVAKITRDHLGYSLKDTFSRLGLDLSFQEFSAAWENAKAFWQERFFNSDYLKHDIAYEGAAEFVNDIYKLGCEIVYLTGRDEPGMGRGTRQNLLRDGFPWEKPKTHLLLKPTFEMDDLLHKKSAENYIRKHGTLVASFENEPLNLVSLSEIFPEAMHIFVDTICSDRPAPVAQGLYRIKGYIRP
ncbi:MAG: HAD family hydrolase [Bdellovibrionales bacterium]|nr:HAD family hydrolase [Bdellovibrionales bacterium]